MNNTAQKIEGPSPRLLGIKDAAQYLNLSKQTLYKLVYSKQISAFKVTGSRVWKFDRQDLDTWIEKQKEQGGNSYE